MVGKFQSFFLFPKKVTSQSVKITMKLLADIAAKLFASVILNKFAEVQEERMMKEQTSFRTRGS